MLKKRKSSRSRKCTRMLYDLVFSHIPKLLLLYQPSNSFQTRLVFLRLAKKSIQSCQDSYIIGLQFSIRRGGGTKSKTSRDNNWIVGLFILITNFPSLAFPKSTRLKPSRCITISVLAILRTYVDGHWMDEPPRFPRQLSHLAISSICLEGRQRFV